MVGCQLHTVQYQTHTETRFPPVWTCTCGHTVEDNDVAHALGCNRLSGLVQSRPDDTAEALREFIGCWAFP
jgi:hypothetical protein